MEIYKGIEIVDLGLYFKNYKMLVISDLQLGMEENLNKSGVLVPRVQYKEIKERIIKIIQKVKPKVLVINGDLKHEFGSISRQEWKDVLDFLNYVSENVEKIILIKGNHDLTLEYISREKNLEIIDEYFFDDILLVHGHKISLRAYEAKLIVIGHEHPAISLEEGPKRELYKCFLKGKYGRSVIIVMPSFNTLREGSDIKREEILSPYLNNGLSNFEVYIVEDKVYKFGKLSKIK